MYLGKSLVAKKTDGLPTYVHTDLLGSLVVETRANKTLEKNRVYYRDFGETIGTTSDDVGYTGHMFDTDLGLSYMNYILGATGVTACAPK